MIHDNARDHDHSFGDNCYGHRIVYHLTSQMKQKLGAACSVVPIVKQLQQNRFFIKLTPSFWNDDHYSLVLTTKRWNFLTVEKYFTSTICENANPISAHLKVSFF